MSRCINFFVPIRTAAGLNEREHHYARHARVLREHKALGCCWPRHERITLPVEVRLIRSSPATTPQDDDQTPGSLKGIRDAIAKKLGVDDGDRSMVRFSYGQARGAWGVEVTLTMVGGFDSVAFSGESVAGHASTEAVSAGGATTFLAGDAARERGKRRRKRALILTPAVYRPQRKPTA